MASRLEPLLRRVAVLAIAVMAAGGAARAAGEEGQRRAQEAATAQGKGQIEQALSLYTEALKDPTLPNDRRSAILSDRGGVYGRLNQAKLAIEDYNRAIQLFAENPAAYNNRGNTLLALGLAREAVKDFDRAILLAPGYAAAYNNRAGAFVQLKQGPEAIRDYTKAIELMPQSLAALNGRGRALLTADRPHAAIRDFSRAIGQDARFTTGYRSRAEAKLEVERYADAAEDLSRAVAFEPNNAEVYVLRGQAYLAAKNNPAAIKDFTRVIELAPNLAVGYLERGFAHARIEAYEEAEADISRAIEIDPKSAVGYAYRAFVLAKNGQGDLAQREIDKALKLEPQRAEVQWAKGEIEETQRRGNEAAQSYRNALALRPTLRDAADGLERLGARDDRSDTVEVRGLGINSWRVVRRGKRMFAHSDEFTRLSIPLETAGEGQPRLLQWEARKAPHRNIGTLRFSAGQVAGAKGPEEVEHIAVVDLAGNSVIAVVPTRQGEKTAKWTWDENKIVVASVDGVTDEFILRPGSKAGDPAAIAPPPRRIATSDGPWSVPKAYRVPSWVPWADQSWGSGSSGQSRPVARAPPRQQKPKSLFDLLLGN